MMRYHFKPTKIKLIKKKKKENMTLGVDEDVKKIKPFYLGGDNVKCFNHCGRHFVSSTKAKI